MPKHRIYRFRTGEAEASPDQVSLLGVKGAGLVRLCRLGLPVPPGFTIPVPECRAFFDAGARITPGLSHELKQGIAWIEKHTGASYGGRERPLLLAVRSGAPVSMPGMLDTLVNVGLSRESLDGLAASRGPQAPAGARRFALDCYRRQLELAAEIGVDLPGVQSPLAEEIEAVRRRRGLEDHPDELEVLEELVALFERHLIGRGWSADPWDQLERSVAAVFRSWNNARSVAYRSQHGIDPEVGTAVTVQAMVFGNRDDASCSGVAFSRDPNTGEKRFFGEYLRGAQGSEIVAGQKTPHGLADGLLPMQHTMPESYAELQRLAEEAEAELADMVDLEFTVEAGKLWLLQVRPAARSATAAVRVAVDLVDEKLIDSDRALLRIGVRDVEGLLETKLDPDAEHVLVARGLPASPGAVSGHPVFTAQQAMERGTREPVILVRPETSPDDVPAMQVAAGILTARGGMTSHAAVVARGLGRPCVVGCRELEVDPKRGRIRVGSLEIGEEDLLSLDGTTGEVMLGEIQTVQRSSSEALERLLEWADQRRRIRVRARADQAEAVESARRLGADGIGPVGLHGTFRTPERRRALQAMLIADGDAGRRAALEPIEAGLVDDFAALFEAMAGLPGLVRFPELDLTLLEPNPADLLALAEAVCRPGSVVQDKLRSLRKLGGALAGSRTGLLYPEWYELTTRALVEAALRVQRRGLSVRPEFMVCRVVSGTEFKGLRSRLEQTAERVFDLAGTRIDIRVGVSIDTPRAALDAAELAREADFFVFDVAALTEQVFAVRRSEADVWIDRYLELGLLPADPFVRLDETGVGALIRAAANAGRKARGGLTLGWVSGAADAATLRFAQEIRADYLACAPSQVVWARLAAAQATILEHP